jgi:cyclase
MLQTRVIPCLQLVADSLVKTVRFGKYDYIGDPINTVRIFNELEVDELCFLDIRATIERRPPNFKLLSEIAEECFMPLAYGGGVSDLETARRILSLGFEKIVVNTAAYHDSGLIAKLARQCGSQSVIASIDVKKGFLGGYSVYTHDGTRKQSKDPISWAMELERLGAGELLVTSMDRDGTWKGFELDLLRRITEAVSIPVIANGGAGNLQHIGEAVSRAGVSAVALGSMVVYQKKDLGVLVNFPDRGALEKCLKNSSWERR